MGDVRTYDPLAVVVLVNDLEIEGLADGDMVTVAPNADLATLTIGSHGEGMRSSSPDRSGRLTLNLLQVSPSNDVLSEYANDRRTFPVLIKDTKGSGFSSTEFAWIARVPDQAFAMEGGNRTWLIDAAKWEHNFGGNPEG